MLFLFLFLFQDGYAQDFNPTARTLSFEEILWHKAYDDTTQALARVFIIKRSELKPKINKSLAIVYTSIALTGAGALLFGEPVGLVIFTGGLLYFTVYSIASGINIHRLHPYSKKKFEKLIAQYKNRESLPEYYKQSVIRNML